MASQLLRTGFHLGRDWNQSSALNHQIDLGFRYRVDDTQYLETVDLNDPVRQGGVGIGGLSYVFGKIHQRTMDITLRSSRPLLPEPVPGALRPALHHRGGLHERGGAGHPGQLRPGSLRRARVTTCGRQRLQLLAAVNLNAVYRWEYRPGSALYLVWTHSRAQFDERSGAGHAPAAFDNSLRTGDPVQERAGEHPSWPRSATGSPCS